MVYFEVQGDNDFASIFQSIANERREEEERRQNQRFLRLLEELEQQQHQHQEQQRVEHLRIGPRGDIVRDEQDTLRGEKRQPGRVATLDDLPKESEFEMIFGPRPELEPQLKVNSGRRLHDGKEFHRAVFPGLDSLVLNWSGLPFEMIVVGAAALFFLLVVLLRALRRRRSRFYENESRRLRMQAQLDAEIERRVRERLAQLTVH